MIKNKLILTHLLIILIVISFYYFQMYLLLFVSTLILLFFNCYYLLLKTSKQEREFKQFFSLVTHEIKTPMTAIIGYLDLVTLMTNNNIKNKEFSLYIERIKYNINRIENYFINMTLLFNFETFKDLNIIEIDLSLFIKNLIVDYKSNYLSKNIEVLFHANNIKIHTDKFLLEHIFSNIIDNAFKYNIQNGSISIDIIKLDTNSIEILIKDNGIGLCSDTKKKLFNKFSRGNNFVNEEISGSGIGLYIVKLAIKKLNGEIKLSSDDNGTICSIKLINLK